LGRAALPRPVEPGTFEMLPMVRLRRRRLVDAEDHVLEQDPVAAVRARAPRGRIAYVIDQEGLGRNKADLDTLRKIADKSSVWVDAGSRFATDAMDLLVAGAERVTLRWSALADEEELREAAEVSEPDRLILGLEMDGGLVGNDHIPGGEDRLLALARELGLGLIVLDLARAGRSDGLDRALAARFRDTGVPRWFAGGVRADGDPADLEGMGYRGCVVEGLAAQPPLPPQAASRTEEEPP